MHKDKLIKLANFIRALPKSNFNMGDWGMQRSCGTVACAVGWGHVAGIAKISDDAIDQDGDIGFSWDDVADAYGLKGFQANYLFDADNYTVSQRRNAAFVAQRILKFVSSGGRIPRGWPK